MISQIIKRAKKKRSVRSYLDDINYENTNSIHTPDAAHQLGIKITQADRITYTSPDVDSIESSL